MSNPFASAEPKRSRSSAHSHGKKSKTGDATEISDVVVLSQELDKRRQAWNATGHAASTYVVTNRDAIKLHINMYLAHMAQYFFEDLSDVYALVLDASDMGTSLSFDIFGIKNIIVPNYYKKTTDVEVMRQRMPTVQSFPISIEDYIRIWSTSGSQDYAQDIMDTIEDTTYVDDEEEKERLLALMESNGIPPRPEHIDIAYLDYCGPFTKETKQSIRYILRASDPSRTQIIAITGSTMGTHKRGAKTIVIVNQIKSFMKKLGFDTDQTFIYNRHASHVGIMPGVEIGSRVVSIGDNVKFRHPKSKEKLYGQVVSMAKDRYTVESEDLPRRVNIRRKHIIHRGGTQMYFISFVRSSKDNISQWNRRFTQCRHGACKLAKGHEFCLYHEMKDTKSVFCNRLLDKFFVISDRVVNDPDVFTEMIGSDVPIDVDHLFEMFDFDQDNEMSLYALQTEFQQAYDVDAFQQYVLTTRRVSYKGHADYVLKFGKQLVYFHVQCCFRKSVACSISGVGKPALDTIKKKNIHFVFPDLPRPYVPERAENALVIIPNSLFDKAVPVEDVSKAPLPSIQAKSSSEVNTEDLSEKWSWQKWLKVFGHQFTHETVGDDFEQLRSEAWNIFSSSYGKNKTKFKKPSVTDVVAVKWNLSDGTAKWYSGKVIDRESNWYMIHWDDGNVNKLMGNAFLKKHYRKTWFYIRN
jgi:hypothetical protein